MTELVKYDAACRALAEARSVDEVKDIRDVSMAMRLYARQAKNKQMEADAFELRSRAEKRLGEMIAQQKATVGLATGGQPYQRKSTGTAAAPVASPPVPTLAEAGIDKRLSSKAQKVAAMPNEKFEAMVKAGRYEIERGVERHAMKMLAAEESAQRREASRTAPVLANAMELRIGDCRNVLANVPDNSVPLILTEPPCGDEAEPLYQWLAEWAARVLIPGGSFICYTDQSLLNCVTGIFDEKLRYWWFLVVPRDQALAVPGKFVISGFKPVLWYVKDHRRGRSLVPDMVKSPAYLIEHLTEPGERIVDPFAGTATWGHIATSMGRRWLGADVVEGGSKTTVSKFKVILASNQRGDIYSQPAPTREAAFEEVAPQILADCAMRDKQRQWCLGEIVSVRVEEDAALPDSPPPAT